MVCSLIYGTKPHINQIHVYDQGKQLNNTYITYMSHFQKLVAQEKPYHMYNNKRYI